MSSSSMVSRILRKKSFLAHMSASNTTMSSLQNDQGGVQTACKCRRDVWCGRYMLVEKMPIMRPSKTGMPVSAAGAADVRVLGTIAKAERHATSCA